MCLLPFTIEGKFGHSYAQKKDWVKRHRENDSQDQGTAIHPQDKECHIDSTPTETKRQAWRRFFFIVPRRNKHCQQIISDFQPEVPGDSEFLLFKLPSSWN
jgi:hypothetical protein